MWLHSCPLLPAQHISCVISSASVNVSVFNESKMKFSKRTNIFRRFFVGFVHTLRVYENRVISMLIQQRLPILCETLLQFQQPPSDFCFFQRIQFLRTAFVKSISFKPNYAFNQRLINKFENVTHSAQMNRWIRFLLTCPLCSLLFHVNFLIELFGYILVPLIEHTAHIVSFT